MPDEIDSRKQLLQKTGRMKNQAHAKPPISLSDKGIIAAILGATLCETRNLPNAGK
jgi:hypothetical protein